MDVKLFPEIGGEDGIWIEHGEGLPSEVYVPSWSEIFELVRQRLAADWKTFKAQVKTKWSSIWRRSR